MADEVDITQERMEKELETLLSAREHASTGQSYLYCIDCEEPIPEARRQAIKGCQRCIQCQTKQERGKA